MKLHHGAVRNHVPEIMVKAFEIAGYTKKHIEEKFPALFNAFHYGAPPHAGIAYGLDRLVSLFAGLDSIRDCIAFPKNTSGRDVMIDAPSTIDKEQLEELHLEIKKDRE